MTDGGPPIDGFGRSEPPSRTPRGDLDDRVQPIIRHPAAGRAAADAPLVLASRRRIGAAHRRPVRRRRHRRRHGGRPVGQPGAIDHDPAVDRRQRDQPEHRDQPWHRRHHQPVGSPEPRQRAGLPGQGHRLGHGRLGRLGRHADRTHRPRTPARRQRSDRCRRHRLAGRRASRSGSAGTVPAASAALRRVARRRRQGVRPRAPGRPASAIRAGRGCR